MQRKRNLNLSELTITSKTCGKCKEVVSLEGFYRNASSPDGFYSICKPCKNRYGSGWRSRNREKEREANRRLRKSMTKQQRDVRRASLRSWHERYPNAKAAHIAVTKALRNGTLLQEPCSVCGTTSAVRAHHSSYREEDFLKVLWLCESHHREWHRDNDVAA